MSFTDEEIAYLRSQPIARVATLSADGQPDVVPLAFAVPRDLPSTVDGRPVVVPG